MQFELYGQLLQVSEASQEGELLVEKGLQYLAAKDPSKDKKFYVLLSIIPDSKQLVAYEFYGGNKVFLFMDDYQFCERPPMR